MFVDPPDDAPGAGDPVKRLLTIVPGTSSPGSDGSGMSTSSMQSVLENSTPSCSDHAAKSANKLLTKDPETVSIIKQRAAVCY